MTRDTDIMARTLYGEASNQPFQGKLAVAYVIMNRARERHQSPAGVCLAPKQFSCWNAGDPNVTRIERVTVENTVFCQCIVIALIAQEKSMPDPTNGANHYYADYIKTPSWAKSMEVKAKIGAHIFLKG